MKAQHYIRAALFVLFICFLVSGSGVAQDPEIDLSDMSSGERMHEYLNRLEKFGFHGSALVAQNGDVVCNNAYGLAHPEKNIANTKETLFSTGSLTKQFTATAILYLYDRGRLDLIDSLPVYFDNVPSDKRSITIHHLLTHTSGLESDFASDDESVNRDEYVHRVLTSELLDRPGAGYAYSNSGYSLLAAIIEKVGNQSWESFLIDSLFNPLEIINTGMFSMHGKPVAHSHNKNLSHVSPLDRPKECWNLIGNGGMLSTPDDMHKWFNELYKGDLLSDSARQLMFTPHVREYPDDITYYGYGWVNQESTRRKSTVIWHNGGAMPHGWSCAVYYYAADDALFIVFSNKPVEGFLPVDHLAVYLSMILFGEDLEFPPRLNDDLLPLNPNLEGLYSVNNDNGLEISAADSCLQIIPVGQKALDIFYPSDMSHMLKKYNLLTYEMATALFAGDYDKAAGYWHSFGDNDVAGMLKEYRQALKPEGELIDLKILGTRKADGIETFLRAEFENQTFHLKTAWSRGKCMGMSEKSIDPLRLLPVAEGIFAGYNFQTGERYSLRFEENNKVILDFLGLIVRAKRQPQDN